MGRDESGTVARLLEHLNQRLAPAATRRGGRVVRLKGDGSLVEFASAVDALAAALEFQQAMIEANRGRPDDQAIVFRIGLHLGDVIVEGDDIYGDAVNVAARLEAEAPAGGIVVSRAVREAVTGRLKVSLHALGELALKNVERPIRAFRADWSAGDWPAHSVEAGAAATPMEFAAALTLPDKPSIAVLPFQNMSGDPEQEYFVDGMVEEIITGLSRSKQLFVVARNSSFAYKGKSPDIRHVGRELGVRYVLEGSVRKSGNRVRITGQLVDASSGRHIWADRFDGDLDDIFDLQDRVTSNVIGGILPPLFSEEVERVKRKVGNLQAYDYYLRINAAAQRRTAESTTEALALAKKAIALAPDFALIHAQVAGLLNQQRSFGWVVDRARESEEAERAVSRALELDSTDPVVLALCGQTLVMMLGRLQEGAAYLDQAIKLDPNSARAWTNRGSARIAQGEPEQAIRDLEHATRLSPIDPLRWYAFTLLARAHTLCGRYDKALPVVSESLRLRPNYLGALVDLTVAHALAGNLDAARNSLATVRRLLPEERIARFRQNATHLSAAGTEKYVEGLRLAGLPE
jgi:adenylate cyclase